MTEFELKFQLPPEKLRTVKAFVSGRASSQRSRQVHLQAAYFDTPDRLLARNAIALRLRREADGWVQTLKGGGGDGLLRQEHNLPIGDGSSIDFAHPEVDLSHHAGVEIGDRLISLLARRSGAGLSCRFRTDVRRTLRELSTRFGKVELACDEGFLESGGRQQPLCELEIELLQGHPLAVLDVARRWALRFGLWLDIRSKAERGDMLARGVDTATVREAGKPRIDGADTLAVSLQAVIADCRTQILANSSQIASGRYSAEHLHQLRVGLRRLRTALSLFDSDDAASIALPLAGSAAALFRGLGTARDQEVLAGPMSERIAAAWRESGQPGRLPQWASSPAQQSPTKLVRGRPCQVLLLDLIEVGLPDRNAQVSLTNSTAPSCPIAVRPGDPSAKAIHPADHLARRLSRWHQAVLRDATRFDQLDDAGRHRLRKRLKRLVYGAGFAASLFKRKPLRRLLTSLKPVQRCLGELNDVASALAGSAGEGRLHWFAFGWLLARRHVLLEQARPLLQQLDRDRSVWKRRAKTGRR